VKYRETLQKLTRQVESEKRTIEGLKHQRAEMLQQRTELEVLLNQCLHDVKAEIARTRSLGTGEGDGSGRGGGTLLSKLKLGEPVDTMALHEFTEKDREHVLELLLSQQRVVQLLYNKTFPFKPSSPLRKSRSSSPPKATNEDEFAWLRDMELPQERDFT